MGAQEHTERVLRDIHVLFSKAESYNGSKRDVIVNKQEMMDLLKELNQCMYDMMDEYELSKTKKDKANREQQKHGDDIIFDATRRAEDVYAASIMYTDTALRNITQIMTDASDSVEKIFEDAKTRINEEKQAVKDNQFELRSQLEDMIDTQKYLRLIEDENRRMDKEKAADKSSGKINDNPYAKIVPEIHVNEEYFRQQGIPLEDEGSTTSEVATDAGVFSDEDLDAEYFDWKEQEEKPQEKEKEKKGFPFFGNK